MNDKIDASKLKVPCEVYSRIVGYLRPVQNWNDAKQVEFDERQMFDVKLLLNEGEIKEKDD